MNAAPAGLALWMLFLLSWWSAALWTGKAVSRGALGLRLVYSAGFAVGFGLLFAAPDATHPWVGRFVGSGVSVVLFWRTRGIGALALLAMEAAGFAFAWWARVHLGRLWSGMLTLREGHRVVDSGPYRLVRHPIYTGFILAAAAYALICATPTALAGAFVLAIVMTVKARGEERLLRRELGAAAYDAYAARTPMIVPFTPV